MSNMQGLPPFCFVQLLDLILELLLFEGIVQDKQELSDFNKLVYELMPTIFTTVNNGRSITLIQRFLELSSWFSSVYNQNLEVSIKVLDITFPCLLTARNFHENSIAPKAVIYRQVIVILLKVLTAIFGSNDIPQQYLDQSEKVLRSFVGDFEDVLTKDNVLESFLELFTDQDDILIDAMNHLLSVYEALDSESKTAVYFTKKFPVVHFLKEKLFPPKVFADFLEIVHFDHSVLLDFLISDETNFLSCLLNYLHFEIGRLSNSNNLLGSSYEEDSDLAVQMCLQKLRETIQKLQTKNLFPYNIQPLVKRLLQLERLTAEVE